MTSETKPEGNVLNPFLNPIQVGRIILYIGMKSAETFMKMPSEPTSNG